MVKITHADKQKIKQKSPPIKKIAFFFIENQEILDTDPFVCYSYKNIF